MPSFPYRCKACKKLVYTTSALTSPGLCIDCGSVEFTKLTNICYLVTTPTEEVVVPEIGSFLPEKFPIVYRTQPHSELGPESPNRNISTACGSKKLPVHCTDQVIAVTCETCLKMAPAFTSEPEQENILTQARPLSQKVDEIDGVEITETFENEDPNPFISKGD